MGVELRDHVSRRLRPVRRAGGDQPHVVEPRAAEGGVEEIVAEGILAREPPYRHIGHVVVAHGQATVVPASVIPGDELVHAAAVDLILLLIEEVDGIAGELVGRDIAARGRRVGRGGQPGCAGLVGH